MVEAHEALRQLRRRADGGPRQTEIFTATDWSQGQEHLWCYVVQHRIVHLSGWEPWESDTKPAHFRREADAIERMTARRREIDSPLIEFRVAPKWLGYVPDADADEKWIR